MISHQSAQTAATLAQVPSVFAGVIFLQELPWEQHLRELAAVAMG